MVASARERGSESFSLDVKKGCCFAFFEKIVAAIGPLQVLPLEPGEAQNEQDSTHDLGYVFN